MKKRAPNLSTPLEALPPSEPPAPVAPAPRTLADVPNLGPIRLRALQKAGWNNLRQLKTASLSDLAAVPGISEVKARQLSEYLAQFPELPDTPLHSAPAVRKIKPDFSPYPDLVLITQAAKILGEMGHILLRTPATERRSRLSRQFETMEETLIPFVGTIQSLPKERLSEAETLMNEALIAFRETRKMDKFSKKAQGDLADKLETFHAALSALSSEGNPTEPNARMEAAAPLDWPEKPATP